MGAQTELLSRWLDLISITCNIWHPARLVGGIICWVCIIGGGRFDGQFLLLLQLVLLVSSAMNSQRNPFGSCGRIVVGAPPPTMAATAVARVWC